MMGLQNVYFQMKGMGLFYPLEDSGKWSLLLKVFIVVITTAVWILNEHLSSNPILLELDSLAITIQSLNVWSLIYSWYALLVLLWTSY